MLSCQYVSPFEVGGSSCSVTAAEDKNRKKNDTTLIIIRLFILIALKVSDIAVMLQFMADVYTHRRRLCSNWVRHGSTTISYPQCSLTFMRERYLAICIDHLHMPRALLA